MQVVVGQDAELVRETLRAKGFTIVGELYDKDVTPVKLRKQLSAAKKLLKGKRNARFVFFLASHGHLDEDDEVTVVNNLANAKADGDADQYHTYFSAALVGNPHVTTALDHALCFSPACRLSDFVGSLNAELEMGATCTVGEGQCA